MADRIRPVHSSSRSRTRAPTLQFGRSFNLLRQDALDHEVVIDSSEPRLSARPAPGIGTARSSPAGSYHRSPRLAPAGLPTRGIPRCESRAVRSASCCPAFARSCPKIPFFCPAVDTRRGLISPSGAGKWGDCQMMIKASGRSALILATGLFVCFAGPSPATAAGSDSAAATSKSESATSGKSVRQGARHWKRYAHASQRKVASKSADSKKVRREGRR